VASLLEIHETHLVHEELRSREQLNICFSQRKCTPGQVGGQNHISDPETAFWEAWGLSFAKFPQPDFWLVGRRRVEAVISPPRQVQDI